LSSAAISFCSPTGFGASHSYGQSGNRSGQRAQASEAHLNHEYDYSPTHCASDSRNARAANCASCFALYGAASNCAATFESATPQSPEQSARAAQLLSQVSVRDETSDSGYDRDLFNHWIDANGDGCNTRCEVLRLERRATLPGLSNGGWLSLYDGKVTENPSEFDIDHVVALGEAWRSGASQWDGARRQAFANDLDDPLALIAVSASSNRSKSDSDPSGWQPPNKDYWCEYVTAWMAIKLKWDLAVDPIEFTALQSIVESC